MIIRIRCDPIKCSTTRFQSFPNARPFTACPQKLTKSNTIRKRKQIKEKTIVKTYLRRHKPLPGDAVEHLQSCPLLYLPASTVLVFSSLGVYPLGREPFPGKHLFCPLLANTLWEREPFMEKRLCLCCLGGHPQERGALHGKAALLVLFSTAKHPKTKRLHNTKIKDPSLMPALILRLPSGSR